MNDTARMLADTAERLFDAHCEKSVLIAAENGRWPTKLWDAVEEAGLTMALTPEDVGGVGLDIPDALSAVRIAARYAAPVPLAETLLAAWLLSGAGLSVPHGAMTIAPVAPRDALTLTKTEDGFRLDGSAYRIPFGRHALHIAVLASLDGATHVACVDLARCTIAPGP